jgi:signal transduction histidine kinase
VSLRTRLLLASGYVVTLVLIAFAVPLAANLRDRVGDEVREQARNQADVLAASVPELVRDRRVADLGVLARRAGAAARGRVVIVDRAGRVLADSAGAGTRGASYRTRPELAAALAGRRVQEQRHSQELGADLLATAAPVFRAGRVVGGVRLTQSVSAVDDALRETVLGILAVGIVVLLAALGVAYVLARTITQPIERLRAAAERVAGGDLDARAAVEGGEEQRSLARSFNTMTERVGRSLRAQGEFVADASHQLRTPLTGLRLRLDEARHAPDRASLGAELDAAQREVERMAQTVEELLVLSRTGERDAPASVVEVGEAAEDARLRWASAAAAEGVRLELAQADAGERVWCARPDLDRALDAVIENAILYAPAGTTVTIRPVGSAIDVLDEGAGLQDGEEEEVFARFHRGSVGRAGPAGTGLGLPIARELMRCWQGDADLRNRPEGGARASLRLPPFTGTLPGEAYRAADA